MIVRIVGYQGVCDVCGEPAPDVQDSEEAASQDAENCSCLLDPGTPLMDDEVAYINGPDRSQDD